jgi:hypothetical protein
MASPGAPGMPLLSPLCICPLHRHNLLLMTPETFVQKWTGATLSERAASHEHFLDLCHLLDQPTPAQSDPTGQDYCFEKPVHANGVLLTD